MMMFPLCSGRHATPLARVEAGRTRRSLLPQGLGHAMPEIVDHTASVVTLGLCRFASRRSGRRRGGRGTSMTCGMWMSRLRCASIDIGLARVDIGNNWFTHTVIEGQRHAYIDGWQTANIEDRAVDAYMSACTSRHDSITLCTTCTRSERRPPREAKQQQVTQRLNRS